MTFTVKEEEEFVEETWTLNLIEEAYNRDHKPKIREGIAEIRRDHPEMVSFQYVRTLEEFQEACKHLVKVLDLKGMPYWALEDCRLLEKRMRNLSRETHIEEGKKLGIDAETIARAREFPIGELLEVKRGNVAVCPFHDDKHPSMDVRKNFWYCYVCGEGGDTIDLLVRRDKLTFREAVGRLSTGGL